MTAELKGIHAKTFQDLDVIKDVLKLDEEKIADLEKENERLTVSYETLKLHDEEEIGMLKSENAELRQQYKSLLNSRNEELAEHNEHWNVICERIESNLTKAKELLKKWVELYKPKLEGYPITPIQVDTEQFLSEVDK